MDSHARIGSTEVEDSIAVAQPTTSVLPLSPAGASSSSPLSSVPSCLSSPVYVKTEDDEGELEAGRTEGTFVASSTPPKINRRKVDVCAVPDIVAILRVIDTSSDVQEIASRRVSKRIQDAALKSSRIGASSKAPPPSTKRRRKCTVKHTVKLEEAGHNSGSLDISKGAETFSLGVGNGVRDVPLASNRGAPALSGSTLKRKYGEEGQNLEDLSITGSARTVAATKTGLDRARAKSLPFGCVDGPGTSHTGAEVARCRSMDKDPGGLGPLTEHGMAGKDTMYVETGQRHRKPATKSARRKLGRGKYSSITNEAGGDESSASNDFLNSSHDSESTLYTDAEDEDYEGCAEDEGSSSRAGNVLPYEGLNSKIPGVDRFATHELKGSPKLSGGDSSKKQKLIISQSPGLSIIKAPEESGGLGVRDPRVNKDAFWLVDGILCTPVGCNLWVSF